MRSIAKDPYPKTVSFLSQVKLLAVLALRERARFVMQLSDLMRTLQEAEARSRRSVGAARESGTGESTLAVSGNGLVTFGKEAEATAISVDAAGQAGPIPDIKLLRLMEIFKHMFSCILIIHRAKIR